MTGIRKIAVAALALTVSGGLHAAGLVRFAPPEDVALQGGQAQYTPELGDSFADMAQGAAMPVSPPTESLERAEAEPLTPAQETPRSKPVTQAARLAQLEVKPVPQVEALPPVLAPEIAAIASAAPDQAQALPRQETLTPVPRVTQSPSARRPQARPVPRAAHPDERAKPKPQAPAQAAGNADHNATRGTNAGQEGAKAPAAQTQRPTAQGDGGAAANASYGRAVLTQINRTRKKRAPSPGRTVVGFSISEGGGLAAVRVIRSSGSPDLDQVALDHIRRAAPFPRPPAGAQRQFSFEFVGRN
ncbi:MAG: TonB family protein [Paracoccaceae bacterium]